MSDKKKETHPENQPQLPPYDPRMMAAMYGMPQEDEIDLLEYWRVIWGKRKQIISVAFAAAVIAAGISLLMPNYYRAEVLLAPVKAEESKSGGLSSLANSFGGLASLAGISLGGGGSVEENLAVLKSREFLWKFFKDEKLMPILFESDWDADSNRWVESDPEKQPSLWDAYRLFTEKGLLLVLSDKDTGLVKVSVEWKDENLAAAWANLLIVRLNNHLRQQAIERSQGTLKYLKDELERTHIEDMRRTLFELIGQEQKKAMLANTQKHFAFQVLDAAAPPDEKIKPKRSLIVVLVAIVVGLLMVVVTLVREGLHRQRNE
ncbi:LPS O-antigen chain length determinant protein, WzzB/FepE family [Mariprofundus aestuarium]|uniref:LPS O-antigen chain length determinant protein, WzzB/FepE family n=1 Tax=Mariprofundus aestuarium TaxID=1921086 RepID=A0A2K8KY31_MARES|nr:Wzz/FepE/Etk N-terminal domain-containing protein [Mariprofundus aestuarium]ATX79652.1 LPS O-antigen chain length determinant protein, WzzB/FepE family [Mariprofundus aestuarium]